MVTATRMRYRDLYTPPDVEEAIDTWNASCGPAALGAILRRPLSSVAELIPEFRQRGYMNPSQMLAALARACCAVPKTMRGEGKPWPSYGLGFIQWHGPWLNPAIPIAAAYRHTHWIGIAETVEYGRMIYDINALDTNNQCGAWVPVNWWSTTIIPEITATIPRATGDWHVRWSCEVQHSIEAHERTTRADGTPLLAPRGLGDVGGQNIDVLPR
jgi:hypothetical protein